MSDENEFPSEEELAELPLYSKVAYAVRCALRVQPFWTLWANAPAAYKSSLFRLEREFRTLTLNTTNSSATKAAAGNVKATFSVTKNANAPKAVIASLDAATYAINAAKAANATPANIAAVNVAANAAANAGVNAINAANAAATNTSTRAASNTAKADYAILMQHKGIISDASESGPLGSLWHGSLPAWYPDAKVDYDKTIAEWERELSEDESKTVNLSGSAKINITTSGKLTGVISDDTEFPIDLYINPGDARKETIQNLLDSLSNLHIAAGGFGLEFIADDLNIKVMEGITK